MGAVKKGASSRAVKMKAGRGGKSKPLAQSDTKSRLPMMASFHRERRLGVSVRALPRAVTWSRAFTFSERPDRIYAVDQSLETQPRHEDIPLKMAAIGSLVFCTDCGNLLDGSAGKQNAILTCQVCGASCKGILFSCKRSPLQLICSLQTHPPRPLLHTRNPRHFPQPCVQNGPKSKRLPNPTWRRGILSLTRDATSAEENRSATTRSNSAAQTRVRPCFTSAIVETSESCDPP
jgi:hypothetical protein